MNLPEIDQLPPNHRSGFVAVIGRPNVGKSTLFNRLLGQKIAITSPKPQTTRDPLLGILSQEDAQVIFQDTPGLHTPKHKLGQYMVSVVEETIVDADVVLWLVDANVPPKDEEHAIADFLQRLSRRKSLPPLIIGLNKIDQLPHSADSLNERGDDYRALLDWLPANAKIESGSAEAAGEIGAVQSVPFSALTGESVDRLLDTLLALLPLGPRYYPSDQVTDLQTRFIVAELIREKALLLLQKEVPHSIAVQVDEFVPRDDNMTYIAATIYVERNSQKGIVLGQNGAKIKEIGRTARPEIEEMVGTKVYLELWVKVWEKWRKREGMLRQLGYASGS